MGLETGSPGYISDLIATNPLTTDSKQQGDDHLRFIKLVLKNTFPNATKPFTFPDVVTKTTDYGILASEMNRTFLVDTTVSSGGLHLYLPALSPSDAGWMCNMMKYSGSLNPIFIHPPSGNLLSGAMGLSYVRRSIPYTLFRIFWTGGLWVVDRVPHVPVGTVLEYQGGGLPVGYEWPNGQTLSPAYYPEFAQVRSGGVTQDRRGRYAPMADQGAGRLAYSGVAGAINSGAQDGVGGEYYHVLTAYEMAPHTHNGSTGYSDININHTHTFSAGFPTGACSFNAAGLAQSTLSGGTTSAPNIDLNAHTHSFSTDTGQGVAGGAHNILPPTIVCNFILVVE